MVRSDQYVKRAADWIEYVETGAHHECLNLVNHGLGERLMAEEVGAICQAFGIQQTIF